MLSSCAHFGVGYYPFSNKNTFTDIKAIESLVMGNGVVRSKPPECSTYIDKNAPSFNSKENLLKYWGTPYKIENKGIIERFIYKGNFQFSGVYAYVMFVPIPLVIPSPRKLCIVELTNGMITGLERIEKVEDYGYACGGWFFQGKGSDSEFLCGMREWKF